MYRLPTQALNIIRNNQNIRLFLEAVVDDQTKLDHIERVVASNLPAIETQKDENRLEGFARIIKAQRAECLTLYGKHFPGEEWLPDSLSCGMQHKTVVA